MRKEKNELLMFLAGLAMLIVGLYILSQRVMVHTSWWGIGGFRLNGGLIFIPFIAGIIWLFATESLGAKVLTGLGVAFVVISVILSVDISLVTMTLFDWVVLLVLIFGGIGLLCRVLFGNKNVLNETSTTASNTVEKLERSVDDELASMRKDLDK